MDNSEREESEGGRMKTRITSEELFALALFGAIGYLFIRLVLA